MIIYCHNVRVWTRDLDKKDDWFWRKRMERIKSTIQQNNPDILCLQELSFPASCYIPSQYKLAGCSASHHIYIRKGLKKRNYHFHTRWESCEVLINGKWVLIINVHLHWDRDILERNMKEINKLWMKNEDMPVIMCGDWNNDISVVMQFLDGKPIGLRTDAPSFKNKNSGHTGYIDYAIINEKAKETRLTMIKPQEVMSDHNPIVIYK